MLANCPFHGLVEERRDLVCGMNHDLLCGMAGAVGDEVLTAQAEAVGRPLLCPPRCEQTWCQGLTVYWMGFAALVGTTGVIAVMIVAQRGGAVAAWRPPTMTSEGAGPDSAAVLEPPGLFALDCRGGG